MKLAENEAINLLKKYSPSEKTFQKVLRHSRAVQKIALRLARSIECDREFLRVASLLHDIGRFDCPPGNKTYRHGIIGAEILRKEGISEKYARVCERHLGAGISKSDIRKQGLDLPIKDFNPETVEEKIITVADNLVFGDIEKTINDVYEKFSSEVDESTAKKAKALYDEVLGMRKKNKK